MTGVSKMEAIEILGCVALGDILGAIIVLIVFNWLINRSV